MKEGYIKRRTSTIPFGYEESDIEGYLKPIEDQIEALQVAEDLVTEESIPPDIPITKESAFFGIEFT